MRVGTAVLAAALLVFGPPGFAQEAEDDAQAVGVERAKIDDLGVIAVVYFAVGSAELDPHARTTLDEAAQQLAEGATERQIEVGGHTDSSGAERLNTQLSQQRAQAVRAYLLRRGFAAERLVAIGYGMNQPAEGNDTAAGRARNRRVHLKLPD